VGDGSFDGDEGRLEDEQVVADVWKFIVFVGHEGEILAILVKGYEMVGDFAWFLRLPVATGSSLWSYLQLIHFEQVGLDQLVLVLTVNCLFFTILELFCCQAQLLFLSAAF
jgi:hypothetical protein